MANLPWAPKSKEGGGAAAMEVVKREPDHEEGHDSLHTAMEELHSALDSKDYKRAASVFRAAFDLLEIEPHEEGPHI